MTAVLQLGDGFLSAPEVVEYPTEGGKTAFMNYYPPRNQDFALPQGQLPPLLVLIHGGPTSQCSSNFSLKYQFWTSRGVPGPCLCGSLRRHASITQSRRSL